MSNPHFNQTIDALNHIEVPYTEAEALAAIQAQATLALAYEQRTANLIALFGEGFAGTGLHYGEMHNQIKERLGR